MTFKGLHPLDRPAARAIAAVLALGFGAHHISTAAPQGATTTLTMQQRVGSASPASRDAITSAASDPIRAHIEALPRQAVEAFYLRCSGAAMRGLLGAGETQACSIGYDVLLKRHFGGDFLALLSWSRDRPLDEVGAEAAGSE